VTQLALLLTLGLIGLVAAFALGRLELRRGLVAPTVKRIEGAVDRACQAVLWRGGKRALLLLSVPALALVTGSLLLSAPGGAVSPAGRATFCGVALLIGALSALLHARLVLAFGVRACSAAAAAAARGSALALRPLLRGSGAAAVFGEGLGLIGLGASFCLLYAVRGGFAQSAGSAELVREVVRLLPAFALGAAVTALAMAREGGALATAALVGGGQTVEREAALPALDPRNPATLAELIGAQVGGLMPRALVGYVAGLGASVGAAVLSLSGSGASQAGAFRLLLLLLIVRAFGVIGSMCGVFAARSEEHESAESALWRGQLTALAVSAFGAAAGLYWLRIEATASLLIACAAGLLVASCVSRLAWLPLRRGAGPARETAEARNLSEGAAIALGAGSGLTSLLPALLLPALGLWLLEGLRGAALGSASPAPAALLVAFVAGLIATLPLSLAVNGLGLLADASQTVAVLAQLGEHRRGSLRLDEVSSIGGGAAGAHASLALAASLLLGLFALGDSAPSSAPAPLGPPLSAALVGITLVLLFAARSARGALLGARVVADEVRRQLRAAGARTGTPPAADFTPSYKACVDTALASSSESSLWLPGAALLAPFVLGALSALLGNVLPRSALLGFACAAVLSGLVFVLSSRATRAALREARLRSRNSESNAGSAGAALSSFGDLLGIAAATGVEALIGTIALSTLSLPFLFG
jgi:K(+)-stimulated pyrophosphate-energized sodium pump